MRFRPGFIGAVGRSHEPRRATAPDRRVDELGHANLIRCDHHHLQAPLKSPHDRYVGQWTGDVVHLDQILYINDRGSRMILERKFYPQHQVGVPDFERKNGRCLCRHFSIHAHDYTSGF